MSSGLTMRKALGDSLREGDRERLTGVCDTLTELFSATQVVLWSYQAPAAATAHGRLSLLAGARWDGRELPLSLAQEWQGVPIADLPVFGTALAQRRSVSHQGTDRNAGRMPELARALGATSFDCEPVLSGDRTVGFLTVDPPRLLDTERAVLLPLILEDAAFVLSKMEMEHYRHEARFLLELIGRAVTQEGRSGILEAICSGLAARLDCRHATLLLPATGSPDSDPAWTPVVSMDGGGRSDLPAWKSMVAAREEVAEHLAQWAVSEVPLEMSASGWWSRDLGALALLGAAVRSGGDAIGLLLVDIAEAREFTRPESYLVHEVASLLGWLLPFSELRESLSSSGDRADLAGPWLLGGDAEEERSTDDVVSGVCAAATRLLGTGVVVPVAAAQLSPSGWGTLPSMRTAMAHNRVACDDDLSPSPGGGSDAGPAAAPPLRSAIAIPLGTGGRPLYLIACGDPGAARSWSGEDQHLAQRLAVEGSLRLEMARLARVDRYQVGELSRRLLRDPLTALPNSVLLIDRIEQAIHRALRDREPLALVCVDIDHLRDLNHSLGEENGDRLLAQVAQRLSASLRISDVVARVGGDEFAVLLTTSATSQGVQVVLDKIARVLSLPYELGDEIVMVTTKTGVALWPGEGEEPAALLSGALEAVRRASALHPQAPPPGPTARFPEPGPLADEQATNTREHREEAVLPPSTAADSSANREVGLPPHVAVADLPRALEAGELLLHYLPKVSVSDGNVTSMEALVRWNHPHYGMVPPSAFLPLVADSDLGWQITHWVLNTAMDQCAAWIAAGLNLTVTVNVSRYDVTVAPLIDAVRDALARTKLLGRHLTLEISEQAVMDELVRGSAAFILLRSDGVKVCIDDFGSGKVAPLYLARMPIDEIKIDNRLLTEEDPADIELVRDIVRLGHEFGIQLTAEAVEGFDRAGGLEKVGVDNLQGFHIAGPLLPENVPTWVSNHRSRTHNDRAVIWTG